MNGNKSQLYRVWQALLALVIMVGSLAATQPAAAAALSGAVSCASYHTILKGETLFKIGLKYDMVWTKIADANGIKNANKIYAGQKLCIPISEQAQTQYILALTDVNIRKGPGMGYAIIEVLHDGQHALVTGRSVDLNWWRVICPDGTMGECYVTANPKLTELASDLGSGGKPELTPTFSITAVVRNKTVTIQTANFPKDEKFVVRMGDYGTKGVNGIVVAEVNSGQGGVQSFTFDIPSNFKGSSRIAIRMDSVSGRYAYNWFWNTTAK